MILSTLLSGITFDPSYAGSAVNDEFVLGINLNPAAATEIGAYGVVGLYVEGVDAQLNPKTSDKTYIRMGLATTKTGNQRSFKLSGDRYIGDAVQDYVFGHEIKYGVGKAVETDYVYFNMVTGKGEQGRVAIIVNSDGGGNGGDTAKIDVEFKACSGNPTAFTYTPVSISALTVTTVPAADATAVSKTASIILTFSNAISAGNIFIVNSTLGTILSVAKNWDATGKILTITPSAAMAASSRHEIVISGVKDVYEQTLTDTVKYFTTAA